MDKLLKLLKKAGCAVSGHRYWPSGGYDRDNTKSTEKVRAGCLRCGKVVWFRSPVSWPLDIVPGPVTGLFPPRPDNVDPPQLRPRPVVGEDVE